MIYSRERDDIVFNGASWVYVVQYPSKAQDF